MAHLASEGRLSLRQIQQFVGESRHAPGRQTLALAEPFDADWLARLARVLALQQLEPQDLHDAVAIYDYLHSTRDINSFAPMHRKIYGELLCVQGRDEALHSLLPDFQVPDVIARMLTADLANPHRGGHFSVEESLWMTMVGDAIGLPSGYRIGLAKGEGPPFDRLASKSPAGSLGGPLITVVVTSYCPDEGLITAVRSMIDQTWADLEVLVVDDGSPASHRALLEQAVELDPRVRLVVRPQNGGTYRARNTALEHARGEFLTFQDSDDWSHPRRLELQVQPLLEDRTLLATRSRCVRVTDELTLTHLGYKPFRSNASSLMFRLEPVVNRIGFFDEVRKGADTEYHERLMAHFGAAVFRDIVDAPVLAVVRRSERSLSRAEFSPGWRHPARFAYKAAYQKWHGEIQDGADPFLPRDADERPFPAPRTRLPGQHDSTHYDVVLAGDWRAEGGPQRSMVEEISALLKQGRRVGVAHMEALRFMTTKDSPLSSLVEELRHRGSVDLIQTDDDVQIDLLMLRYPPLLQFPAHGSTAWSVKNLWIIANQAPSERDGRDLRYLVEDCSRNARTMFGASPTWVPQGPTARDAITDAMAGEELALFDNPGIIDSADWYQPHSPEGTARPRVGRYSRDTPMKFPQDRDALLATYGDPGVDVRMMGAVNTVHRLLDGHQPPENWELIPHKAIPVRTFLQDIDFFVYFDHPLSHEAFGRSVLEAIASGCVVVLPWHYKRVFDDAALYASPQEAMDVVHELHADPALYRTQVRSARDAVESQLSHDAFYARVRPYLDDEGHADITVVEAGRCATAPAEREAESLAGGFAISSSDELLQVPASWAHERVGELTHVWSGSTCRTRLRIVAGDRTRDPYDVVFFGRPLDLDRPSADPEVIAERAAGRYAEHGLDGLVAYVSYLGGRFVCVVQDADDVVVVPDAFASEPVHWTMGPSLTVASHEQLVGASGAGVQNRMAVSSSSTAGGGQTSQLRANHHLRIDLLRGSPQEQRFYPLERRISAPPLVQAKQELVDLVGTHVWLISSLGPVALHVTGDELARQVLSLAAPYVEHGSFAFSVLDEGPGSDEVANVVEANARAVEVGLHHRLVRIGDPSVPPFSAMETVGVGRSCRLLDEASAGGLADGAADSGLPEWWTAGDLRNWEAHEDSRPLQLPCIVDVFGFRRFAEIVLGVHELRSTGRLAEALRAGSLAAP